MMLGRTLKELAETSDESVVVPLLPDLILLARARAAAEPAGLSLNQYVLGACRAFLDGAAEEDWATLMSRLGYERFAAQGGDWGSAVTCAIAALAPERLYGIHVNMPTVPLGPIDDDSTERERQAVADFEWHQQWGTGYQLLQSTRPQTLGYGLADSPVGQLAWVVEKFWAWTDCDGHPENALTRDQMLDDVMLYWLPGNGASSARLYWESFRDMAAISEPVPVPVGVSIFPKEIFRASKRWAEKRFTNLIHWNELPKGGHFAAFEQPELFVGEVRTCFRKLR